MLIDVYHAAPGLIDEVYSLARNPVAGGSPRFKAKTDKALRAELPKGDVFKPGKAGLTIIDGIAVVQIVGVLTKNETWWMKYIGGTSTVAAATAVRQAEAAPDVAGILLLIDSGGGEVRGVGDLADAVFAARQAKPVHAYGEDVIASAAYQVGAQASKLTVSPSTAVGSIGTYAVIDDWSEAFSKAGVRTHILRAGKYKGIGVLGTAVTEDQLEEIQRLVDDFNELFLQAVSRGRGMGRGRVEALADGRVHVGEKARGLGLVDGIGTLGEAFAGVRQVAGPQRMPKPQYKNAVFEWRAALDECMAGMRQTSFWQGKTDQEIETQAVWRLKQEQPALYDRASKCQAAEVNRVRRLNAGLTHSSHGCDFFERTLQ